MTEAPEETSTTRPEVVAHDQAPSQVTDHKFMPKGEWYTRCKHCNLSEAAHAESELQYGR